MSGAQVLAFVVPAITLLLTATLEVAFHSAPRLELRKWAQEKLADEGEEADPTRDVEMALTAVRLARQLSLLSLAAVVGWLVSGGVSDWGLPTILGWELPWVLGLAVALYVVIDKLFAFALVAAIGPLRVLSYGRPLIALLGMVFGWLAKPLYRFQHRSRARKEPEPETADESDLDAFLDMAEEEGLVSEKDEELLRGVADFGEAVVRGVMVPRVDIVSIGAGASLSDLRSLVAEHKLSRIPVVRESVDQVAGVVHIKDLVTALEVDSDSTSINDITRPALFVPETGRVRDLLREFQRRRAQLAIVVDEYGGTAGLVTLEDLLEEIVGEIQDEYEDDEQTVIREADGAVIAAGKAEVEEVERIMEVEIGDEEFETVGGLAFAQLGRVPRPGEVFDYGSLHIEVLEADDRHVQRVRITRQ